MLYVNNILHKSIKL